MQNSNDRPVVEATLESGEVIVDILMRGDVLAEIPLIGTAIKICKAADTIRDRAFAIKLARFVQNFEDISLDQKRKLKEKMLLASSEAKKVGETLFFVLDRVTDLDKPVLLSKVFLAYIDGVVTSEQLRRLCQAIDTAFPADLQQLLAIETIPEKSEELWMQYLAASGLTRLIAGKTFDELGTLYYEVTPLGKQLRIPIREQ